MDKDNRAGWYEGAYFFRYDIAADKTDDVYPQPIAGHCPGVFARGSMATCKCERQE